FPFDKQITEKLKRLSAISEVYRTQGVYDLITKIVYSSEKEFKETMSGITRIDGVNSTLTLLIADKRELIAEMEPIALNS
ncbi:MAG TPA: Lrp/AsnC ligand binding domain-containing protein, partial [Nitrososphaeraceae archaeon]|nr:Lrp/AsnC ligand binding domain-containing protein [Nitrososphaeraceae archaeon]